MANNENPNQIHLKGVRLSYPNLGEAKGFQGSEPKFSATFILDKEKDADQIKEIKAKIAAMVATDFKGKSPGPDKICLKDGTSKGDSEGYGEGVMYISASNKRKPALVDQKRNPIDKDDPRIFGGVYVNAVVNIWKQDNQYGKRINASLEAVQYARTGDAFGNAPMNVNNVFEELPDETDSPL